MSGDGLSDVGDFYYYEGANKFSQVVLHARIMVLKVMIYWLVPSDTNRVTYVGSGACILGGNTPRTYLVQLCDIC